MRVVNPYRKNAVVWGSYICPGLGSVWVLGFWSRVEVVVVAEVERWVFLELLLGEPGGEEHWEMVSYPSVGVRVDWAVGWVYLWVVPGIGSLEGE